MNSTERMQLRESGWRNWSMTFHEGTEQLWELVRERRLYPMDLCVKEYLLSQMNTRTGQIEVRTKDIAKDLGLTSSQLTPSIKRLRDEMLLAKGLRGAGYFWMLNPAVWHAGGRQNFDGRMKVFMELANG